ncbi:ParB/RepB/Spo0J family partition protein [Sinimarinibacterium sp. NLF-5-8]|uniref:ParB/RepB/Spo0J family partition protein n=1 Tax=Sinimarinibacterium sp. NLF-5-8 TaxID=2698684 RepID=UPI00137BB32C|nr:ParB/RepB/Spo0J family partition protein [Sinimarinibacterium sp. NLF-5-8]QHS10398.1 ParB/RepB/Spo0J family partition protein [Sinimarinibacterium sp. NLF-5-8]
MSTKKRGLGRGLDALLGSAPVVNRAAGGEALHELALDVLQPGQHQPRRHFDEEALAALADSVRAQGIVQPIVVRPIEGDRYEIVAGERRWRAAQIAGLKMIPVVVRALDERGAMAVGLVENIQRSDLNPLEEAEALRKLIEDCGLTHEKAAEAVGRSRAHVSNLLRLMELDAGVQPLLRDGRLSLGHAKVLLGVQGQQQLALARRVVEAQLSVRQTEALVHAATRSESGKVLRPRVPTVEKALTAQLGLPVRVQQAESGRGKLTVSFRSQAELEQLLARFGD